MEQRIFRGEKLKAEALANYLVEYFEPRHDLQAQRIGQDQAFLVQVARGDVPGHRRHAISVTLAHQEEDGEQRLVVTMGQQQWLDHGTTNLTLALSLLGAVITPFALFALLWPLNDMMGSVALPSDIWREVQLYVHEQGGDLVETRVVRHPHATN